MMNLFDEEKIIQVLAAQYSRPGKSRADALRLIVNNLIPDFTFFDGLTETSAAEWVSFFNEPSNIKVLNPLIEIDHIPNVLVDLYSCRPDLQSAFDLSDSTDAVKFLGWFFSNGVHETELKAFVNFDCELTRLIETKLSLPSNSFVACLTELEPKISKLEIERRFRDCLKFRNETRIYLENRNRFRTKWANPQSGGINLIGYFSGSKGIAEDARLTADAFDRLGIPNHRLEIQNLARLELSVTPYSKTLFCVPADVAFLILQKLGKAAVASQSLYFSTPWELPVWPPELECVIEESTETFVHSTFVFHSIPERLRSKVALMPLPVVTPVPNEDLRERYKFGSETIAFFSSFDFASYFNRKNPTAVVEAFLKAFPDKDEKVCLILKSTRATSFPSEYSTLERLMKSDHRIKIIDEDLDRLSLINLYNSCDVFVSLHRSEGFGRNIAEAMKLKKLVIVTGYSGNMTFTDDSNALLVPFDLTPLSPGDYIFTNNEFWANPDCSAAAKLMRKSLELLLTQNSKELTDEAAQTIETKFSLERLCEFLEVRFKPEIDGSGS